MNELIDLAGELQRFCVERDWKFCFIGGITVQHWSEPRMTNDVDLTLLTGFGGEEIYIDEWLRHYEARISEGRKFALANRVLLLRTKSGLSIDIALGALPFEERAIARAIDVQVSDKVTLRFCSPEDLIVMKAFASRERDWHDIRMTVARQGVNALDWEYIREQLAPLVELKDEPEILDRLKGLRNEYS